MEMQTKKTYGCINVDQILEAKKGLETLEVEKTYTISKAVYELRNEIGKLVRKGVKISQIITELKKHNIGATRKEIKEILGEIAPKKEKIESKKVEKQSVTTPVQKPTPVPVTTLKPAAPKPTPTPTPGGTAPTFKVPDLSTLPPELTSLPGFDPAIEKPFDFTDENGREKTYFMGRIVDAMKKGRSGFNMNKPAALKV